MDKEEYKNIKSISFPNTVDRESQEHYGNTMDSWSFEPVMENREMAAVAWIAVYQNMKKIAHIKQSVCNIFFK